MNRPSKHLEVLARGRAKSESRMTSTCVVTRKSTEPAVRDEEQGTSIPAPPVVVYPDPDWPEDHPHKHGPCRFKRELPNAAAMQNGQSMAAMQLAHFEIPVGSPALKKGDKVECLTSDVPVQVGMVRTVRAEHVGEQTTAQRYQFEEVH